MQMISVTASVLALVLEAAGLIWAQEASVLTLVLEAAGLVRTQEASAPSWAQEAAVLVDPLEHRGRWSFSFRSAAA